MPHPTVSVLIPCFRSAAYLHRALDGVLAQSFAGWEAVVVDNASDDGTFEVARGYAARDPRVRAFRNEENVGPVRNWRRCAELARGEVAALLFSDDWWEPGFLAAAVPLLGADVGLVFGAVRMRQGGPAGPGPIAYQLPAGGAFPSGDFLRWAYLGGPELPVSPGCALARTADLRRWLGATLPREEEMGYLRHGAGPDLWVYLQACRDYPRLAHLREPLVSFLDHPGNLTKGKGVWDCYPVALLDFYLAHRGIAGLPDARVLASLYRRLRRSPARPRVRALLGLRGWAELARLKAARRVARLLRRPPAAGA